jgi:hypothetical protein
VTAVGEVSSPGGFAVGAGVAVPLQAASNRAINASKEREFLFMMNSFVVANLMTPKGSKDCGKANGHLEHRRGDIARKHACHPFGIILFIRQHLGDG